MFSRIKKIFLKKNQEELLGGVKSAFMSGDLKTNFNFEDFSKKNIFNLLSKSSNYGFYYWPYGYLFRHVKWGTINELGFRCENNFNEINQIHSSKYLVGFFGGSTGFDVLVNDENTLVNKLEKKINSSSKITSKIGEVKIINFSQPGNVLMNQIINYIQFGSLVNLKTIISHNLGNDMGTGIVNDPKIVKKYKINYVDILEAWSRKIHEAYDIEIDTLFMDPKSENFKPVLPKTDNDTVLKAYIHRCKQFNEIVTGTGQKFMVGLMPHIFSKKKLSKNEELIKTKYNPYYQEVYKALEFTAEIFFEKYIKEIDHIPYANLHEGFKNLNPMIDHFGDVVHLTPEGNEVASDIYFKKFEELHS